MLSRPFMHDGQNLFEPSELSGYSWEVDKTLDELFLVDAEKYAFIVVGIDSNNEGTKRLDEYCPWQERIYETPEDPWNYMVVGGEGEAYATFLAETLKPFIDEKFRTIPDRNHTFVAGSSMGGLISLYAAIRYNDVFSKVGAFSTALLFAYDDMVEFITKADLENIVKIWMYVGGHEVTDPDRPEEAQGFFNTNTRLVEKLKNKFGFENVVFTTDEDGTHSEEYWQLHFREFIKWAAQP